ncbi:MAG: hypothetical protein ACKONH_12000 [Planctomycetia bacterium]
MLRRSALVLLALTLNVPSARAAENDLATRDAIASLEERLTAGLKARTPAEVAFCARVAELVRTGRLPAQVVDSTYLWAVRRGRKHPFPAFQYALRAKAEKLGVTL